MDSPGSSSNPLTAALRILRHQWLVMGFFALVVMGATVVATLYTPKGYRSQARVLLRLGRENVTLDPTVTLGQPVVSVPFTRDLEINTALDLITSRGLADALLAAVGPNVILGTVPIEQAAPVAPDGPEGEQSEAWQAALEQFRKYFQAEVAKKSSVLIVSYESSSPQLAQFLLNRFVTLFIAKHGEINRTPGSAAFLATQTQRLEKTVRQTEDELRHKKASTGIASPETQRQLLAARMARLEDEFGQAKASLAAADAEIGDINAQLDRTPATHPTATVRGIPGQAMEQMRTQIATLKVREAELLAKHGEAHPDVKPIRRQLKAAEDALAQESAPRDQVTTGPNRLHEEASVALLKAKSTSAALRARVTALEAQVKEERARLSAFASDELDVSRLQRKLEIETAQLKRYTEAVEQGQVDRALQAEKISNVTVAQPASFEPRPVRPRLAMNLAIGAGFALIGAAGLGFLMDQRTRGRDAGS